MWAILAVAMLGAIPMPKDATIIDSRDTAADHLVGNVKVIFADGHSEKWTKLGNCMQPRVSEKGMVGWARISTVDDHGEPMFCAIRVCWPDGHYKTVGFDDGAPYFEDWDFAAEGRAVAIKTRWPHGPDHYVEYDLETGRILAKALGPDAPTWAPTLASTDTSQVCSIRNDCELSILAPLLDTVREDRILLEKQRSVEAIVLPGRVDCDEIGVCPFLFLHNRTITEVCLNVSVEFRPCLEMSPHIEQN
jgi:hypothetical protein